MGTVSTVGAGQSRILAAVFEEEDGTTSQKPEGDWVDEWVNDCDWDNWGDDCDWGDWVDDWNDS